MGFTAREGSIPSSGTNTVNDLRAQNVHQLANHADNPLTATSRQQSPQDCHPTKVHHEIDFVSHYPDYIVEKSGPAPAKAA